MIDIDADTSDPVTVSEYANEIFVNMKRREVSILILLDTVHLGSSVLKCQLMLLLNVPLTSLSTLDEHLDRWLTNSWNWHLIDISIKILIDSWSTESYVSINTWICMSAKIRWLLGKCWPSIHGDVNQDASQVCWLALDHADALSWPNTVLARAFADAN